MQILGNGTTTLTEHKKSIFSIHAIGVFSKIHKLFGLKLKKKKKPKTGELRRDRWLIKYIFFKTKQIILSINGETLKASKLQNSKTGLSSFVIIITLW